MIFNLDTLTDQELQYLVKTNLELFLTPMKKTSKAYMKYSTQLGNKTKKSILVQKNLPAIAVELFRKHDQNYVKAMEAVDKSFTDQFLACMRDALGDDVTRDSVKGVTDEEITKAIGVFKKDSSNSRLDYELLWIQMKLLGIPDVDDRRDNILKLCGEEKVPESDSNIDSNIKKETEDENSIEISEERTEETPVTNEKKKVKPKKLTAEEKAAKNKAAIEKKEKEKKENETVIEESDEGEERDEPHIPLPVTENDKPEMSVEDLKKKLEDDIVSKYVGVIKIIQNYYNFTPIGKIENNEFFPFSQDDLDRLLPKSKYCNINFYYSLYDESHYKFMNDRFSDGQLVVLNAEIDDLEENWGNTGTGYKVPAIDGCKKGTIKKLSDIGLFTLLTKENLLDDFQSKKTVRIECDGLIEDERVLVNLGEGFYAGPFVVKYSSQNNTLFINMQTGDGKYFVSGYKSTDCDRVKIEPMEDVEYRVGGYNSWSYYIINEDADHISRDYISDKDLLDSFKQAIENSDGLDYSNLNINGIVDKLDESLIVGKDIPAEIKQQRIERITTIMSSEEDLMRVSDSASELIADLLIKNKGNEKIGELLSEILSKNPTAIEKLQGIRVIQTKLDNMRAELEQLEARKSAEEAEAKSIREGTGGTKGKQIDLEADLTGELAEKKAELESLMSKIKDASQAVELQALIEKLRKEAEYYEKHKDHLVNDTKDLESNFVELINGYSEKIADVAFDGFMSSKMLQAASGWEKKEEIDELARRVMTLNSVEKDAMSKEELVDYVVKMIQILRPSYNRNTIVNILTCITQGFLTVFSGIPGCGKTSICNIVSRVLGLNNYGRVSKDLNGVSRYIQVSVERGWTSKRDLIGYYNPLTKAFEESNRDVFDALQLLDMESKNEYKKWPFFILLDEANLSPMEYYWADFMNVCDDRRDNSVINLGNDNIFEIPETLHFLATINNDHTTETLSPRLIDRAWIISLPKVSQLHYDVDIPEDEIRTVSWEELINAFSPDDEEKKTFDRESQVIFEGIKDKLSKQELYLSPRVRIAIERYWFVASKLMTEDDYGNTASVIALDYAVAQKILPKLMGSGDEYEAFLEDLKKYCDEKNLTYTTELLGSMINRGNRQMKYYQFFN